MHMEIGDNFLPLNAHVLRVKRGHKFLAFDAKIA